MSANRIYTLVLICLTPAGSVSGETVEQIEAAAGTRFIVAATGEYEFALPTILLIDPKGCLIWSKFGFADPSWKAGLRTALDGGDGRPCSAPVLPTIEATLQQEGAELQQARLADRHILFWYGSDALCASCVDLKATVWPEMKSMLPPEGLAVVLEWRQ
jgi:hypothetical protein